MKLIVFGSKGMLGSTLVKKLIDAGYDPEVPDYRITNVGHIPDLSSYDIVFNCLGAIPQKKGNLAIMLWANTCVPRLMARTAKKLVHFSTDCIFSGLHNSPGGYTDIAIDWGTDDYSWSKRNGEVTNDDHVLNIRTSIIGHRGPVGLLDWFLYGKHPKNDEGVDTVTGYSNHYWNGFTTNELSNLIIYNIEYVRNHSYGTIHLGGEQVSKYELLDTIKKVYQKKIIIQSEAVGPRIDKCLQTSQILWNLGVHIKSLEQQIIEMREDELRWFPEIKV